MQQYFNIRTITLTIGAALAATAFTGCKKFAEVPPASNIMNASYVFTSDATVNSAVLGMYSNAFMYSSGTFQTNLAVCPGFSADELRFVGNNTTMDPFFRNALDPNNATVKEVWAGLYKNIYLANAIIEGVTANEGLLGKDMASTAKGEGLFMRAICHFYLTNLFGDVVLVTTTDAKTNNQLPRLAQAKVYEQIITDLKTAKDLMKPDYSASATGQRFRPNKFAAAALLARTYLYTGQWALAESEASFVLDQTALYKLMPSADILKVFYKNSMETIWQMNGSTGTSSTFNGYNALASHFVGSATVPSSVFTDALINSFAVNDLRWLNWTKSITYAGNTYRQPFKYRNISVNTTATAEGYTYLRLAEQFLIRAEARAKQGTDLVGAKNDLDSIRVRAQIPLTTATTKDELLTAIEEERNREFFTELGHRWFDLKRTGRTTAVLGSKPGWEAFKQLYPIPNVELLNNSNLSQNDGYKK